MSSKANPPVMDRLDDDLSRVWLMRHFHPDGLRCPRCGAGQDEAYLFRRTKRSRLDVYRCKDCMQTYTLYSGTVFEGRHFRPAQAVRLIQGLEQDVSTAQLARELDMSRTTVHDIRQQLLSDGLVADLDTPLADALARIVEEQRPASTPGRAPERPRLVPAAVGEAAPASDGRAAPSVPSRLFDAGLRPENALLVQCARLHPTPEIEARIRALLAHPIDWMHLMAQGRNHGLFPLLYHHLARTASDLVPPEVLQQLRTYTLQIGYQNLRWTRELLELHRKLEPEGIPVVPFKGPLLAREAYGNLGLRPFVDLDLLVRREDIPRIKAALVERGYRPETAMTEREETAYLDSQYAYAFVDPERRIVIELHWAMAHKAFSFPLDPERLWTRLEPVTLGGRSLQSLSKEDLVLFLCAHGAKHFWTRLLWIADLDAYLRAHPDIDWDALQREAVRSRSERMLHLGLYLAAGLAGAPLPPGVMDRVEADPNVRHLAVQACSWMFRSLTDPAGALDEKQLWLKQVAFQFRMRERGADLVPYTLERLRLAVAPSAKDRAFLPLPSALSFLYAVVRPVRILRDAALELARHLRNRTGRPRP